jgi:steroid 5-alpha reductase family enzyme
MLSTFLFATGVIVTYMTLVFAIAWLKEDNSVADIAWGAGFIILTAFVVWSGGYVDARQGIVAVLVTLWALRLTAHLYWRNRGIVEREPYRKHKENWHDSPLIRSFFQIFMAQGILLILIATPIIVLFSVESQPLMVLDLVGILVWLLGFAFETVADLQLKEFVSNNANQGRVMRSGLWRLSRHPNYFGESVMWWGIFIIVSPLPYAIFALISPILITYLLFRVTGVPVNEKKYEGNAEYAAYQETTSVFVPWWPKKAITTGAPEEFVAETRTETPKTLKKSAAISQKIPSRQKADY